VVVLVIVGGLVWRAYGPSLETRSLETRSDPEAAGDPQPTDPNDPSSDPSVEPAEPRPPEPHPHGTLVTDQDGESRPSSAGDLVEEAPREATPETAVPS